MSIRAISRITGIHRDTVLSLMVTASEKAGQVFDHMVRNIRPKFVELDELWAMIGCHGNRVTIDSPADWGDAWTWLKTTKSGILERITFAPLASTIVAASMTF